MDAGRGDHDRHRPRPSKAGDRPRIDAADRSAAEVPLRDVLAAFRERLPDEAHSADTFHRYRWPDGFRCPVCGSQEAWQTDRGLWVCIACRHQTSSTAGTALDGTRLSRRVWLEAAWLLVARPVPPSASALQAALDLGSHETAGRVLRTLRRAMRPTEQRPLRGTVYVTVAPLGGSGRSRSFAAIAVAPAVRPTGAGRGRTRAGGHRDRVRARVLRAASVAGVVGFVAAEIDDRATLVLDRLPVLRRFAAAGLAGSFEACCEGPAASVARRAFVNWLEEVPGGSQVRHVQDLLDEFAFRFAHRDLGPDRLFETLLSQLLREQANPAGPER